MNNVNMANMNPMGGPVGMPMVNNGPMGAIQAGGPRQQPGGDNRANLNTYIYDYFLRNGMYDCARALLNSEQQINVTKESPGRRRDGDGNSGGNSLGDDAMDTDSKEDLDSKRPDDLPAPNVPNSSNSCFLYEWFCLFWDMLSAQRNKPGIHNGVSQYVSHTQQQSRMRQNQQQEMLRNMRPENVMQFHQNQMMQRMPNGMNMNPKQPNLARTAMANNQNNPQAIQMLQQAKQAQMQRDPSDMDGNRARPASPGSAENAPSPSKRPRLEGQGFGPQQPGMMPNGRPQQGMPGQQVGNGPNNLSAQAQQMLQLNGIDPSSLTAQQFQNFQGAPPGAQAKSIATYSANLQQHQSQQMPNKQGGMPHPGGPQGSPMMPQAPDGAQLGAYYNAEGMPPGAMRPGGPAGAQGAGGSNHALQDYQMQLMLLEQQNKKRLMMARQEQESLPPTMGGRQDGPGGPGGPAGPNGQPFPDASPQGGRPGASPNPSEQMKRGTPQMNPAGIPSPLPEGAGQSRGSPNPMNFIPGNMADPSAAPHFFKAGMNGMEGNMMAAGMNGMRPPSSHPGQPFNGQMTPQQQQQMMARQQQQGQPGGPQMQQWQQGGPNGQMIPPGAQGQQQVQGTPQQRSMPPPSAPAGGNNNANARTQPSSPSSNAAPPTPQQANKAAPKKKDTKANAKSKAAAQKKGSNANLNAGATPASEPTQETEPQTPATPITPVNPASFNKGGAQNANAAGPAAAPNGQQNAAPAPPAPVAAPQHPDPLQNGGFGLDNGGGMDFGMDFANPTLTNDVLQDFDFDSFLHDGEGENGGFDFNAGFSMDGANEIGAE